MKRFMATCLVCLQVLLVPDVHGAFNTLAPKATVSSMRPQTSSSHALLLHYYNKSGDQLGPGNKKLFDDFPSEAFAVWDSYLDALAKRLGEKNADALAKSIQSSQPGSSAGSLAREVKKRAMSLFAGDKRLPVEGLERALDAYYLAGHHQTALFRSHRTWLTSLEKFTRELVREQDKRQDRTIRVSSLGASTGAEAYSVAAIVLSSLEDYATELGVPDEEREEWLNSWNVEILAVDYELGPLLNAARGTFAYPEGPASDHHFQSPPADYWEVLQRYLPTYFPSQNGVHRALPRLRSWVKPVFADLNEPLDRARVLSRSQHILLMNNFSQLMKSSFLDLLLEAGLSMHTNEKTWICTDYSPQVIICRMGLENTDATGEEYSRKGAFEEALNGQDYVSRIRVFLDSLNMLPPSSAYEILGLTRAGKPLGAAPDLKSRMDREIFSMRLSRILRNRISLQDHIFLQALLDLDLPVSDESPPLARRDAGGFSDIRLNHSPFPGAFSNPFDTERPAALSEFAAASRPAGSRFQYTSMPHNPRGGSAASGPNEALARIEKMEAQADVFYRQIVGMMQLLATIEAHWLQAEHLSLKREIPKQSKFFDQEMKDFQYAVIAYRRSVAAAKENALASQSPSEKKRKVAIVRSEYNAILTHFDALKHRRDMIVESFRSIQSAWRFEESPDSDIVQSVKTMVKKLTRASKSTRTQIETRPASPLLDEMSEPLVIETKKVRAKAKKLTLSARRIFDRLRYRLGSPNYAQQHLEMQTLLRWEPDVSDINTRIQRDANTILIRSRVNKRVMDNVKRSTTLRILQDSLRQISDCLEDLQVKVDHLLEKADSLGLGLRKSYPGRPQEGLSVADLWDQRDRSESKGREQFLLDENLNPVAHCVGTHMESLMPPLQKLLDDGASAYVYGLNLTPDASLNRPLLHPEHLQLRASRFKPEQRVVHQVMRGSLGNILPVATVGVKTFEAFLASRTEGESLVAFIHRTKVSPAHVYKQIRKEGPSGSMIDTFVTEIPRRGWLWKLLLGAHPEGLFVQDYRTLEKQENRVYFFPPGIYGDRNLRGVSAGSLNGRFEILKDGLLIELFQAANPDALPSRFVTLLPKILVADNPIFSKAKRRCEEILALPGDAFLPRPVKEFAAIVEDLALNGVLDAQAPERLKQIQTDALVREWTTLLKSSKPLSEWMTEMDSTMLFDEKGPLHIPFRKPEAKVLIADINQFLVNERKYVVLFGMRLSKDAAQLTMPFKNLLSLSGSGFEKDQRVAILIEKGVDGFYPVLILLADAFEDFFYKHRKEGLEYYLETINPDTPRFIPVTYRLLKGDGKSELLDIATNAVPVWDEIQKKIALAGGGKTIVVNGRRPKERGRKGKILLFREIKPEALGEQWAEQRVVTWVHAKTGRPDRGHVEPYSGPRLEVFGRTIARSLGDETREVEGAL